MARDIRMVILAVAVCSGAGCNKRPPEVGPATAASTPSASSPSTAGPMPIDELARRAAKGDVKAALTLANMYSSGYGVAQDLAKAASYLQRASDSGSAEAMSALASRYRNGDGVRQDFAKARALAEGAAQAGVKDAVIVLAELTLHGQGRDKDVKAAVDMLRAAGESGSIAALERLGEWYYYGRVLVKDESHAVELWQRAAEKGSEDRFYMLGYAFRNGEGARREPVTALRWWERGDAAGDADSAWALAEECRDGEIVPRNDRKSTSLFQRAAVAGHASAQRELAFAYMNGVGIEPDDVLAHAWANTSATNPSHSRSKVTVNGKPVDPYVNAKERIRPLLDIVEGRIAKEHLAEAQELAASWSKGKTLSRKASAESKGRTQAGTAFFVSADGYAVTNAHVADSYTTVAVRGGDGAAKVVARDELNDLALLKMTGTQKRYAQLSPQPQGLRQGDDIFVYGFPLSSVLSTSGNLTQGLVSALTGLGNNSDQIQITAAIQPGSSGSPLVDKKGHVVGVVSSELSDVKLAQATGQVGQAVNFAVGGQTLLPFLRNDGVAFESGRSWLAFDKSPADLADVAKQWTVSIECKR